MFYEVIIQPQDLLLGKIHFVRGLLARDIANYSYSSNTHLTLALNPLSSRR